MGQEIVYCFRCSSRIVVGDPAKGGSYTIGDRIACAECASALLTTLPAREREELLSQMQKVTHGKMKAVSKRTPGRGTEVVPSPYSGSSPSKTPLIAGAVGIVLVILIVAMVGKTPARVPDPVPALPERRPERTPVIAPTVKESYDAELARIDESIAGVNRQEGFKEALDYLASARKRHDGAEWTLAIDRRIGKTNDEIQILFDTLRTKALDARRRGAETEVKETTDRITRWNLPEQSIAFRKAMDAAVAAPFKQGADGIVCFEAEHFSARTDAGGHSWTKVQRPSGYEGDGAMAGLPNDGTAFMTDYATRSPRLDFRGDFVKTGTHYLWVRAEADTDADNSVHGGLDGVPVPALSHIGFSASKKWVWANKQMNGQTATFTVATAGVHTINLWMREDGAVVDRIILTTDPKWSPKGSGPVESPR